MAPVVESLSAPRRRLRFLTVGLLMALLALAVASCSFPKAGVPGPSSSGQAPAAVPVSDQNNVSPWAALDRLGRWNGSTFVPVAAGSIPTGNLIVMTHGWAVGWLQTYEQLQSNSTQLVTYWDAGMVDAQGAALASGFEALAASLQKADPTSTVLMFSWVDQSSTDVSAFAAYAPERATEVNGHRMATAIDQALVPGFVAGGGLVHLIGHSFGANVATTAALSLSAAPRQLTLFDSPEVNLARIAGAKNDLRYKLPRLNIGRAAGQTFVDNYISLVGERFSVFPGLGGVVDVQLAPPTADNGGQKHEFAIGWYTASASATNPTEGYGWSPLIGANNMNVGTYWVQNSPTDELGLTQVQGPPAPSVSNEIALATQFLVVPGQADNVNAIRVSGNGIVTSNLSFVTDEDSLWLTFSIDLRGRPADTLQLFVDGRQRSIAAVADDGMNPAGQFVILYDIEPGTHVLTMTLGGPTPDTAADASTSAVVSNLQIVSTANITRNVEPADARQLATWAFILIIVTLVMMIGLTILLVVWIVRRVRRRRGELND
jgi:pimeloyl-ACP methyl ester carboxylesterase